MRYLLALVRTTPSFGSLSPVARACALMVLAT